MTLKEKLHKQLEKEKRNFSYFYLTYIQDIEISYPAYMRQLDGFGKIHPEVETVINNYIGNQNAKQ